MKKIINERLTMLSTHILNNDKVLDIGCDHALLEIYLCQKYNDFTITGSDINQKPLIKAQETINKYHLNDRINLVLANGLDAINDNIDTLVISGMGSINMINILSNIQAFPNIKKIILSPNNDFSYLRYNMNKLGFFIKCEEMIKEKDKYYLIIEYIKGREDIDTFFGKLDLTSYDNKEYFKYIYHKNKLLINTVTDINKKNILINENKKIEKAINL